jgi:hypothetical protein
MNATADTRADGTNSEMAQTRLPPGDHSDYSWLLLGLLALALIASGLRGLFWKKNSNQKTNSYETKR